MLPQQKKIARHTHLQPLEVQNIAFGSGFRLHDRMLFGEHNDNSPALFMHTRSACFLGHHARQALV